MEVHNQVVLYGAGKRGKKYAGLLHSHGIDVVGFSDSYKSGNVLFDVDGLAVEKPILDVEEIKEKDYFVIISIVDYEEATWVCRKLNEIGVKVVSLKQMLYPEKDIVSANRDYIAEMHIDGMDDYFTVAEDRAHMDIFWQNDSLFYQLFVQLNLEKVVELACGRGRHVPEYLSKAQNIVLVDILKKNIDYCRQRFCSENKIQYYVNNGFNLKEIDSDSCTALFTYDAMVHFEMMDIFQYLLETKRILRKGGKALFHHSNNTDRYDVTFLSGRHGRNYMSKQLFAHLADRAGLRVVEQHVIDWAGEKELDCVTLVEKSDGF